MRSGLQTKIGNAISENHEVFLNIYGTCSMWIDVTDS